MSIKNLFAACLCLSLGTAVQAHRTSHPMRVTNYSATGSKNADGTFYGGWRIAADWRHYPPGSKIRLYLPKRTVVAVVHDSGSAVKGKYHVDAPLRAFRAATGLSSRGTAYCRYEVLYRAPKWNPKRYHHQH